MDPLEEKHSIVKWTPHSQPASGDGAAAIAAGVADPPCQCNSPSASPEVFSGGRFVSPSTRTPRRAASTCALSGAQDQHHQVTTSNDGVCPDSNG